MTENQGRRKIVFALHGAGLHGGIWGGLAPHLPDHQLIANTLPGHREDKPGPLLPTIADMVKHAEKHLSTLPPADIVLVGHSMGALVALELAQHANVKAIVLMGASAEMPVDAALLDAAQKDPSAANAIIAKAGVAKTGQAAAISEMVSVIQAATDKGAVYADLNACNNYKDGATTADKISKPALVIAGENDRLAPMTQGHDLADQLQHGELVILPHCGHMMMLEKPIETAHAIIDFLQRNHLS